MDGRLPLEMHVYIALGSATTYNPTIICTRCSQMGDCFKREPCTAHIVLKSRISPQARAVCALMAGPGKRLRAQAGPVSDVVPGAAPTEGAAESEHVVADIGMGPAHAVCGGSDSVDELGEAAAVAPAAGGLEPALQPVATEGEASSTSAPGGHIHQPTAEPSAGVASSSGWGQGSDMARFAARASSKPRRNNWTTPPVVNNLVAQGGAIILDLNGRRWKGSFASSFSCRKGWTLSGFSRRSSLDHVFDGLWRASGADRPSTAYVDQIPRKGWCGNLGDGRKDRPQKRPKI